MRALKPENVLLCAEAPSTAPWGAICAELPCELSFAIASSRMRRRALCVISDTDLGVTLWSVEPSQFLVVVKTVLKKHVFQFIKAGFKVFN